MSAAAGRTGDDDAAERAGQGHRDVERGCLHDGSADAGEGHQGTERARSVGPAIHGVPGKVPGSGAADPTGSSLAAHLLAAKVRFWVTMCPRTAPVSTASASFSSPLTGFQSVALTALTTP